MVAKNRPHPAVILSQVKLNSCAKMALDMLTDSETLLFVRCQQVESMFLLIMSAMHRSFNSWHNERSRSPLPASLCFAPLLLLSRVTVLCRSTGKDITDLHAFVHQLVARIIAKYATPNYTPVVFLERPVPLYERVAFYSVADVALVTATRDGMNLVPYEYVVARQGPEVGGGDGHGLPWDLGNCMWGWGRMWWAVFSPNGAVHRC